MTNLYKSCFSPTGNMRRELFKWVNPDQYGNIFNATNDSLDLKSKRFMAFDFTHIFEDEVLAPAVISYIMPVSYTHLVNIIRQRVSIRIVLTP